MEKGDNYAINFIVENQTGTIAVRDFILDNCLIVMSGDAQVTQIDIDKVNDADHQEIQNERISVSTISLVDEMNLHLQLMQPHTSHTNLRWNALDRSWEEK
jgi:uncharacterized protein with ACT and thioredoxin-like domain